jgi:MurNAc alpha-1-phosphate uridylyltransferase
MQAVVLAGGLATRMQPQTLTIPKSLLPVAGRPFVDWQLETLVACGYDDVILCVGHLGERIEEHVGRGERFGARVRYAHDGDRLLGTGGALRAALGLLAPLFLVTYGDSYLPFDYAAPLRELAARQASGECDGVMSVYENDGKWDASNVATDGTWILRYDKHVRDPALRYIDYGAVALTREIVAQIPEGVASGLDVLQHDLAARRRLRAVVATERFFEIGSPEGLRTLELHLERTQEREKAR